MTVTFFTLFYVIRNFFIVTLLIVLDAHDIRICMHVRTDVCT